MARLVDADELKLDLKWLEDDTPVYHDVMSTIDERATVDAVEVVRCKDCKWYEESKNPEMSSLRFCYRLRNDSGVRAGYNWDGNDFCSYGEWREDGNK